MSVKSFEPMLRDATIKAIDAVGQKFAGAEVVTENAVTRLLNRWNALARDEKENVAGIVIATAVAAVSAIGAVRKGKKRAVRKAGAHVMKRVAKKMAR